MAKLTAPSAPGPAPAAAGHAAPLFEAGFRPFFLGAMIYGALAMAAWMAEFVFGLSLPGAVLYGSLWHAHEMVYGYGAAVVAGFLLTAARNWTGLPTANGGALAALFALWVAARLAFAFMPASPVAPVLDALFNLALFVAVAQPIVRVRQWRQLGILTKLLLIGLGNTVFYLGAAGVLENGMRLAVHGGVYVLIGLILTMARRLIPFFTERGVGAPVTLRNAAWLDGACLASYLAWFVLVLFTSETRIAALFALLLTALHALRLGFWWTPLVLARPLLWSLHLSYACMVLAFALAAAAGFGWLAPSLALHMFALGGIGLVTISMMARVSLGHTGRNVHAAPAGLTWVFALGGACIVTRVLLPLALPGHYLVLVVVAQALWIACFGLLTWMYAPILLAPRVDAG